MQKAIRVVAASLGLGVVAAVTPTMAQDYLPPVPSLGQVPASPSYTPNFGTPYSQPSISGGYAAGSQYRPGYTATGAGPGAGVGPYWAPGGYEPRIGSPYYYHDPNGGQFVVTGNPYYDHYGPGFHREQLHGHYRFPYYNYRAPWYYPGRAVYNRDTNLPW